MNRSRKSLIATASLAVCLAWGGGAEAGTILNGDFESGLANWQSIGLTGTQTLAFGTPPAEGARSGYLSTGDSGVDGTNSTGASVSEIESFLGLTAGSVDSFAADFLGGPVIEGSAIKQTATVDTDDYLLWNYNFLTSESSGTSANDVGVITLSAPGLQLVGFLADPGSVIAPSSTGFSFESFFIPFPLGSLLGGFFDGPTAVTIGFAVFDRGDAFIGSSLLIDQVALTSNPGEPFNGGNFATADYFDVTLSPQLIEAGVPAPATIWLAIAGLAGLRFRRRQG